MGMGYKLNKEELFQLKENYKQALYYFNCYSQFDEEKESFNGIYELDGIKWNINGLENDSYCSSIPYEGEIPFELFENVRSKDGDFWFINGKDENNKCVLTDFSSFIKAISMIHNFYYGTTITYEDIYNFYEERDLLHNDLSPEMSINDLANRANEYYVKNNDPNVDEYDLAINEILEEIEDKYHNFDASGTDYDFKRTLTYIRLKNENENTFYIENRNPKGTSEYSIQTNYVMNQLDEIDEINKLCSLLSLKQFPKNDKYYINISHECLAAHGDQYSDEMFEKNKANSLWIDIGEEKSKTGLMCMGNDRISLCINLNNHQLKINNSFKDKKIKSMNKEEKEAVYNLLCAVKEKLYKDLKGKDNQKTYKKIKNS